MGLALIFLPTRDTVSSALSSFLGAGALTAALTGSFVSSTGVVSTLTSSGSTTSAIGSVAAIIGSAVSTGSLISSSTGVSATSTV